jgi:membrane protein DedA with SNARE-associated domain
MLSVHHVLDSYGYFGIAFIIGFESMGIPLPGETVLISAALYAGTTHQMNIFGVVTAAVIGAVIGDNIGYAVGRFLGMPVMLRFAPKLGINESKLKLGRYLFARYGGAVVFFGRFVALLRALAAFLAGVNDMAWPLFFAANLGGAILWAASYGGGAYLLGRQIHRFAGPIGIATLSIAAVAVIAGLTLVRRHEKRLEAEAEAQFPGPLGA